MAFSLGSGLKGLSTDHASRRSGTHRSFATQADSFPCPYVSPQLREYCHLALFKLRGSILGFKSGAIILRVYFKGKAC
jgi:hypothetical protein